MEIKVDDKRAAEIKAGVEFIRNPTVVETATINPDEQKHEEVIAFAVKCLSDIPDLLSDRKTQGASIHDLEEQVTNLEVGRIELLAEIERLKEELAGYNYTQGWGPEPEVK